MVLFILGLLLLLVPSPYLPTVMRIGLGTLWTGDLLLEWWFSLVIPLSPGLPRSNALCLVLPQRLSIVLWLLPLLSCTSFECFLETLASSFLILLFSGVTMLVLWLLHPTLCFMLAQNTLRLITILFVKRSLGVICCSNSFPLMINLLICLPRVSLPHGLIGLLPNLCGNSPFV